MAVNDLSIAAAAGTSGGTAVAFNSSVSTRALSPALKNVKFDTQGGTFSYCAISDGSPYAATGYISKIRYVGVSTDTTASVYDFLFQNTREGEIDIAILGTAQFDGSSATDLCDQLIVDIIGAGGTLAMDYTKRCVFRTPELDTCTNTVNTFDVTIIGEVKNKQRNGTVIQYVGASDFINDYSADGYQRLPRLIVTGKQAQAF